jgi:O-antigen ligase
VDNVTSIFGWGNEQAAGTKQWRLDWWNMIIKDTLFGPNFWTGRGFGLNLADADGFRPDKNALFPLRSPHNVHITILARAGVPGMVLWELLLVSWFSLLASAMLRALRLEQRAWAGLFVFVGCYGMAAIIYGSFDPALEGPMQGIWFWCVFGLGVGSLMVYRAQCGMTRPRAISRSVNGALVQD